MTLRDLLAQYLEARKYFLAVARDQGGDDPDFGPDEVSNYTLDFNEVEERLRNSLMLRHGLDPRYTTPRPIAENVDDYLVTLVPDPNASVIAERDGRSYPDSWMDRDIFTVIPPSDVSPFLSKRAEAKRDGRAGK